MTDHDTLPLALTALTPAQQQSLVNIVRRAARAEILPRFRNLSAGQIDTKSGPNDLVTEADTQAEKMIARGILQMFPNAHVIGEEAAHARPELRDEAAKAELAFIIDPVDGTWNFAHGLPVFGVILAATRFGRPVFGMLYDAIMDDWITADSETGATMFGARGPHRRMRTAKGGPLSDLSGYMHYYLMDKEAQRHVAETLPDFGRVGALRCSCHEYRMLAQGSADFCLSGVLNPWDHAAGVLICERAGGFVRMLDGRDYDIAIKDGYLLAAANEDVWNTVAERLSFLRQDKG